MDGSLSGSSRTPCHPSGIDGSVHPNSHLPSIAETLTQPALFLSPQSSCQYATWIACGPWKFCAYGTSEWMNSPGATIVAVANLPVIGYAPAGVDAVSIGSRPRSGRPPRPGEISVA